MKAFKDLIIGDKLWINKKRGWTHEDGSHYEQDITWIAEVTALYDNRCEYKAVKVLKARDVCPIYGDPIDMEGGCSHRLFERSPRSITVKPYEGEK